MTRYKKEIREILQAKLDEGLTQAGAGRLLGVEANVISMALNPRQRERLAIKRLPALQRLTSFSDLKALQLVNLHAQEYGGCELDEATLRWVIACTHRALKAMRSGAGI